MTKSYLVDLTEESDIELKHFARAHGISPKDVLNIVAQIGVWAIDEYGKSKVYLVFAGDDGKGVESSRNITNSIKRFIDKKQVEKET